jgi:hypothetical protein
VSVLHFREIEKFFPVRTLFLQGRRAVADLYPAHCLVVAEPRFLHVAQVLAFGDGALPERFFLDGLKQITLAAGFNAGSNQISHAWEE